LSATTDRKIRIAPITPPSLMYWNSVRLGSALAAGAAASAACAMTADMI
jgi:hypothetical protein